MEASAGVEEAAPGASAAAAAATGADTQEGPRDNASPAEAGDTSAKETSKNAAIEAFKAAMAKAAEGIVLPMTQKMIDNKALRDLCHCVKVRAKEDPLFAELAKELPKLGESLLAPLMGTKLVPRIINSKSAEAAMGPNRMMGRVKSYNTKKGFGFVDMPGCPRDIFVFNAHLIGRVGLLTGETVTFNLVLDGGRPQARQVRVVSAQEAAAAGLGPPGVLTAGGAAAAAAQRGSQAVSAAMSQVAEANRAAAAAAGVVNPLTSMKQAMAQSDNNESILAMAAAAAEVPTTVQGGEGAALLAKIQEAQTAAVKENRAKPKTSPEQAVRAAQMAKEARERPNMPEWNLSPAQAGASRPPGNLGGPPGAMAGKGNWPQKTPAGQQQAAMKGRFSDEGAVPTGATIRVTNFPAPDVNNCLGVIQGYDAATGRYSVTVDIMKQGTNNPETVPLQLREEYLTVEKMPAGWKGGKGAGGPAGGMGPPGSLAAGDVSDALRKSAADSLRRFNHRTGIPGAAPGAAPSTPAGQWLGGAPQQPAPYGMGMGGPGFPGGKGAAGPDMGMGKGAMGMGAAGKGGMGGKGEPGYPGAGPPPSMFGYPDQAGAKGGQQQPGGMPAQPKFSDGAAPNQPPKPFSKQQPVGAMSGPDAGKGGRQVLSLDQSMPGMGQQRLDARPGQPGPPPPKQEQAPSGGTSLEHFAKQFSAGQAAKAGAGAMPPPAQGMPPQGAQQPPKAAGPPVAHQFSDVPPEGRVGQWWRVLESKEFNHVIVRETPEVDSKELRRIRPGEVCQQRGRTFALPNGLVRMPVEPEGWVTVHAKFIRGQTRGPQFLEEVDLRTAAAAPNGPPGPAPAPAPAVARDNRQDSSMQPGGAPGGPLGQSRAPPVGAPPPVAGGGGPPRPQPIPREERRSMPQQRQLPPLAQRARAVKGSDTYGLWSREELIVFKDSLVASGQLKENTAGYRVLKLHIEAEESAPAPRKEHRDRDRDAGDRDRNRDRDGGEKGTGERRRRREMKAEEEAAAREAAGGP